MKNEEYNQLMKLMNQYELSIRDCSLKDFRELRYQLKQVKEKIRSMNKQGLSNH